MKYCKTTGSNGLVLNWITNSLFSLVDHFISLMLEVWHHSNIRIRCRIARFLHFSQQSCKLLNWVWKYLAPVWKKLTSYIATCWDPPPPLPRLTKICPQNIWEIHLPHPQPKFWDLVPTMHPQPVYRASDVFRLKERLLYVPTPALVIVGAATPFRVITNRPLGIIPKILELAKSTCHLFASSWVRF